MFNSYVIREFDEKELVIDNIEIRKFVAYKDYIDSYYVGYDIEYIDAYINNINIDFFNTNIVCDKTFDKVVDKITKICENLEFLESKKIEKQLYEIESVVNA